MSIPYDICSCNGFKILSVSLLNGHPSPPPYPTSRMAGAVGSLPSNHRPRSILSRWVKVETLGEDLLKIEIFHDPCIEL